MNTAEIGQLLIDRFGAANISAREGAGDPFLEISVKKIIDVLTFLRDDPQTLFDELQCISGIDYPEKQIIAAVYHLFSFHHRHSLNVKVLLPRDKPSLPSMMNLWKAAEWQERELFDVFGVQIEGHADLRRILLPEDWEGYPLRRDYVHQESYHGVKIGMERMAPTKVTTS